jgi:hypothetical protein
MSTAIKIANGEEVPARQPLSIRIFDSDKKEEAEAYLAEITAANSPF